MRRLENFEVIIVFPGVLCLPYLTVQTTEVCAAELTHSAPPLVTRMLGSGRGDVGASLSRFTRREAVAGGTPGTARLGERQLCTISTAQCAN